MRPAEGSEVRRRGAAAGCGGGGGGAGDRGASKAVVVRGTEGPVKQWWRRGPMDQEGTAESRRGTRTWVAQGDEDAGGAEGRGPAQQWRRRGSGASKAAADGGDRGAAVWGRMPPAAMWPR